VQAYRLTPGPGAAGRRRAEELVNHVVLMIQLMGVNVLLRARV